MMRWDIINHLIRKNQYTNYLELGYYKGWSFDRVNLYNKFAVDPNPSKIPKQEAAPYGANVDNEVIKMTSDDYFAFISPEQKYDIVFIDGLHESSQVDKDIENSLKHLSPGGIIVMHDCNPSSYEMTTTGTQHGEWTGDVYKSFINFTTGGRCDYYVVNTDYGVGVIKNYVGLPQSAKLDYQWPEFDVHRKELLSLISVEEFLEREPINQVA